MNTREKFALLLVLVTLVTGVTLDIFEHADMGECVQPVNGGAHGHHPISEGGYIRINLNSAAFEELVALPGIGEARARAILEWRKANGNFSSVDDLMRVPGIGEKTVERLKPYLMCRDSLPAALNP